jgi:class 3 adenylate cyclase
VERLRTTAIVKTDISQSVMRFRELPEADLAALLRQHRELVSRLATAHEGRIVKPEGDGFWLVFPSVTAGALAATTMQHELRLAQPGKGEDRLSMRVVVTLGDVLEQDGGLVGDAVVLAARLEAITPPDAIYLSAAAWLAVNRAEVRTALVGEFTLKGFPEPMSVYCVEQTSRTRVLADQHIAIADLRGFSRLAHRSPVGIVERVLDQFERLIGQICEEFGGTNRFGAGDSYCVTFAEADRAMAGVARLVEQWTAFDRAEGVNCPMNVAVHKGTLYAFRSYLYGDDLNLVTWVQSATQQLPPGNTSIFVTPQVRQGLLETSWDAWLERVDVRSIAPELQEIEIYRLLRTS